MTDCTKICMHHGWRTVAHAIGSDSMLLLTASIMSFGNTFLGISYTTLTERILSRWAYTGQFSSRVWGMVTFFLILSGT